MSETVTDKLSRVDEDLLYSTLRDMFSSNSAVRVIKSPQFSWRATPQENLHMNELCDSLLITSNEVVMFEIKTCSSPNIPEAWLRNKPFEARKQSLYAAENYLNHDSVLVGELEGEDFKKKKWSQITVLNSNSAPDSLQFVSSRLIQKQSRPIGFFTKTKTLTLNEICAIPRIYGVDGLFEIPSTMDMP